MFFKDNYSFHSSVRLPIKTKMCKCGLQKDFWTKSHRDFKTSLGYVEGKGELILFWTVINVLMDVFCSQVVDRVRENEAVRMIHVKEGVGRIGASFAHLAHKAGIVFRAQQKLAAEIPDVHDRAIHNSKFRGKDLIVR